MPGFFLISYWAYLLITQHLTRLFNLTLRVYLRVQLLHHEKTVCSSALLGFAGAGYVARLGLFCASYHCAAVGVCAAFQLAAVLLPAHEGNCEAVYGSR